MNLTPEQIREMPAGEEMDRLVAEHVMGWTDFHQGRAGEWRGRQVPTDGYRSIVPAFSAEISAAWQVYERFAKRQLAVISHESDGWWVDDDPFHRIQANAHTAPLAICRAALLWAEASK